MQCLCQIVFYVNVFLIILTVSARILVLDKKATVFLQMLFFEKIKTLESFLIWQTYPIIELFGRAPSLLRQKSPLVVMVSCDFEIILWINILSLVSSMQTTISPVSCLEGSGGAMVITSPSRMAGNMLSPLAFNLTRLFFLISSFIRIPAEMLDSSMIFFFD